MGIFGVIFIMGFKLKHNPHPFLRCFSSSVYERLQLCLSSTLHMNEPTFSRVRETPRLVYIFSEMNYIQNILFSSIITFFIGYVENSFEKCQYQHSSSVISMQSSTSFKVHFTTYFICYISL